MESYKQLLLDLQNELLLSQKAGREGTKTVTLDQSSVGRLSRAGALQAQAIALESRRRQELKLQRVKTALQRIASGDFGICPRCGEDIDERRLKFDPTTPLCITCAQTLEK